MYANTGTAAKLILLVLFSSTTLQATDGHIIPVGKQTLTPSHIWYRPCSGIWQSVFIESVPKNYVTELRITQTGHDNSSTFKPLDGQVDESYNLTITTDGKATISAPTSIGILHALTTFTQLFYTHSVNETGVYTQLAPVTIYDAPKFAHRGLNMDISRSWYPHPMPLY